MSTSISELSPKLRGNREVLDLVDAVTGANKRAATYREKAKSSTSPGRATADIQAGSLAHGVIEAVAGQRLAPAVQGTGAVLAFGYGLWTGNVDAILFANGLVAPMTSAQGFKLVAMVRGADVSGWPQGK